MFVAELTASFQGISDNCSTVPCLQLTVRYLRFLATGSILRIHLRLLRSDDCDLRTGSYGSPVLIIAGFICLFFDNGTLAVFANKAGGRRAAAIIPFIAGLIQVFGSALVLNFLIGPEQVIGWMGMFDWATLWAGSVILSKYLGYIVPIVLIPLMLIIPQLQYRRHSETYFTTMRDE